MNDDAVDWTRQDDVDAAAEGWGIFHCSDAGHPDYELERIDFPDSGEPLEDDYAAWLIVGQEDSELHRKALAFLRRFSPAEANAIEHYVKERVG